MPTLKGVRCELLVDGQAATEYATESIDANTVRVHIIATEGKPYGFRFNLEGTNGANKWYDYEFQADGQLLNSFPSDLVEFTEHHAESIKSHDQHALERREMKFGQLKTVDTKTDACENRIAVLTDIGTLKWKVWRCHDINQTPPGQGSQMPYAPLNLRDLAASDANAARPPIFEKHLKGRGITHQTDLSTASYQHFGYQPTQKLDPVDTPFVTFIFRYASQALLEAEQIIPRPAVKKEAKDQKSFAPKMDEPEATAGNRYQLRERKLDGNKSPLPTKEKTGKNEE